MILLAGDLLDDGSREPREELFLLDLFSQAHSEGIDVFVCTGNHDSSIHARLWREHVHLFDSADVKVVEKEKYRVVSQGHLPGKDLRSTVDFPVYHDKKPTIALLHSQVYLGQIPKDSVYHPTRAKDLQRLQYDYIALGHQHTFSVVSRSPLIVYSGSLSPLHPFDQSTSGYVDLTIGQEPIFVKTTEVLFEERKITLLSETHTAAEIYPHLLSLLREDPRTFLRLTLEGTLSYQDKEGIDRLFKNLPEGRVAIRDRTVLIEEASSLPDEITESLETFVPRTTSALFHSSLEMQEIYRADPKRLMRILEQALLKEES